MRIISHRSEASTGQHASQARKRRNKLRRHEMLVNEAARLGLSIGELQQRHEQVREAIIADGKVRAAAQRREPETWRSHGHYW